MKFHLKIRDKATARDRTQIEKVARESGANVVKPLFPDDPEPSLNTLYSIDVSDLVAEKLASLLRSLPIVEFVEQQAKRSLRN